jgi:Transposase DDE domain group 1
VLTEAIAQLPARYRRDLLITVDGAGASHGLVDHITTLNARPGYRAHYSIGWELGARERAASTRVPESAWGIVLDTDGQPRQADEAAVVELTALLRHGPGGDQLAGWPPDMRIIARRERPHPGAQLSLFEAADGWRYQLLATNTPGTNAQFLEARHRPHARVEDNVRTGKQTGLGHLPSNAIKINRAWCLAATIACDLLCWLRLLCLDGPLARAEPKTLRYRLLHTPYPHHPWPAQTQDPHPRDLALGPRTRRLPAHRARPAPTDPMLINHIPAPEPRNHPEPWNPAPTRRESRASNPTAP